MPIKQSSVLFPLCHFNAYTFPLTLILLIAFSGCSSGKQDDRIAEPNLVVIGEDLSGTFDQFPETTEDDLRNLCKALEASPGGGKIYFIGIGSSTPKGYAYCTIKPTKEVNRNDPPAVQRKIKIYNKNIAIKNENEIEAFLVNAAAIFQQRNQKYTDINGFFEKTASIANAPSHKNFRKWLYINSDGKQATLSSNKLNCNLLPAVDAYFVNRGWKKSPDCGASEKLPDTQHFVEHFRLEMEANRIANQK